MNGTEPADTMRERVGGRWSSLRLYVLLNINRNLLTGALAVVMFVVLVVLGTLAVPPFRQYMVQYDPSRYVFQAFTSALITAVTLVVTINQLVLSQELGPLGSQRQRMTGAMSFRGDVEDILGAASPPEPAPFLRALVESTTKKATQLEQATADNPNDDLRERVAQLTTTVTDTADIASDELEGRQFGEYTVVKAALDYNYSWKIYQARRIQDLFDDDLDREERRALTDFINVLSFFGAAREHIKTLYFQWRLVDLSRGMLYLAIPSIAISAALAMYLAPSSFPGTILGVDNLVWIASAGVTVSSLPFLFLTAFILRHATIAKRTLAIGPFILRRSERSATIEWE